MVKRLICPKCSNHLQYIQRFQSIAFPESKPFYRIVCHDCDYWSDVTYYLISEDDLKEERKYWQQERKAK